jgi:hypothetical protein
MAICRDFDMYYVMYNQAEEVICKDIDEVTSNLINDWKLYGFSESEQLASSLLHECKYY